MADPLSIAASIAGLLTLAGALVPKGYALYSKLKRRQEDIKLLVDEVTSFSGLLYGLQVHLELNDIDSTIETSDRQSNPLHDSWASATEDCEQILHDIHDFLEKVQKQGTARIIVNKDFITDHSRDLVNRLERYKSFFTLFLQINEK